MQITRLIWLSGITTLAKGVGVCPRPGGWCKHGGSFYTNKLDCDGDDKPDPFCSDKKGNTGFRSSKNGCRETWNKGQCHGLKNAMKKKALPCHRPNSWCKHAGAKYSGKKDCDGDFIPDPYCEDNKGQKGTMFSGLSCACTWLRSPKCVAPRARAISPGYHLCLNRGGAGHSNSYSTNVGKENLPGCIAYVHAQAGCSTQFSYGIKDGWCDCVPKNKIPCQVHFTNNPNIYTTYTLEGRSYKSGLNLIAANYVCANRGSIGGKGGYSKNVGANKLEKCAQFISTNSKCGPFFSYGLKDGFCDCVPPNKGQCKYVTDANTQKSQYSAYSLVAKKVTIGNNNRGLKTKCVNYAGMACAKNAGNKGIRINSDYRNAGDSFIITNSASQVCARRVNGGPGWGLNLQMACTFKDIPAYQANFVTQASHHLCLNRGSIGGKGLYSKPNKGPKKLIECEGWVRKNKNCGTHFNYGWKDGYCDCVPKGKPKSYCHLYTNGDTIKSEYSAYEIYTTTTTPPPPTPRPTPRPAPPPVKGLKSGMGWKVSTGKCTIDISAGVPCAVSSNYPKKYFRDEFCEISFTDKKKKPKRLDIQMNGEKYFDYLVIDGKEYHGILKRKIEIKSTKFTWSSDFWEEAKAAKVGWKICKTSAKKINIVPAKKKKPPPKPRARPRPGPRKKR